MLKQSGPVLALAAIACLAPNLSAEARPGNRWGGGWDGPGWGGSDWDRSASRGIPSRDAAASREGRIDVARFHAEGPETAGLRHGAIMVRAMGGDEPLGDSREFATFAAAIVDQLAKAGYTTDTPEAAAGQITELRVLHAEITPREVPHKPVSGAMEVGVGNRGTSYGMAIAVDLSKPLPPLLSTRLEVRIRDRASNLVLWEGHAEVATREGDPHWTSQEIASRLSRALFDGFPVAG